MISTRNERKKNNNKKSRAAAYILLSSVVVLVDGPDSDYGAYGGDACTRFAADVTCPYHVLAARVCVMCVYVGARCGLLIAQSGCCVPIPSLVTVRIRVPHCIWSKWAATHTHTNSHIHGNKWRNNLI